MLGKIEGKRRGEAEDETVRWLDSIINSVDMSLSKLREIVENRGAWGAAVRGVTVRRDLVTERQQDVSRGCWEELKMDVNGTSYETDESKDGYYIDVFPGNQTREGILDPCPVDHPHLVNTGDPRYWLPAFAFPIWSFPEFLFSTLELLIPVPHIEITRDNSFKNRLVK